MREYFTPNQMAEILDVPATRVRQWRGLIKPTFGTGPVEYHRDDLVRMAVLTALAEVFEQPARVIDEQADALHLLRLQVEGDPVGYAPIVLKTPSLDVSLKPAIVAALRERIASMRPS